MANKVKPKYAADRAKVSEAFKNGEVSFEVMTTQPRTIIIIGGEVPEAVFSDIQNAIDDVLQHHGK